MPGRVVQIPAPLRATRAIAFGLNQEVRADELQGFDLQRRRQGRDRLTLNRPERMNALSRPLEADTRAVFDEADADPQVRP